MFSCRTPAGRYKDLMIAGAGRLSKPSWRSARSRQKPVIEKQLLELIKFRASQINGCAFCVQFHILQAENLGISADKLNLVVVWRETPLFSARERAALAWTEALTLLTRRQRRSLRASERGIFRARTDVSHVRDRLDQRLEQVRRGLSLDAAGTAKDGQAAASYERD